LLTIYKTAKSTGETAGVYMYENLVCIRCPL